MATRFQKAIADGRRQLCRAALAYDRACMDEDRKVRGQALRALQAAALGYAASCAAQKLGEQVTREEATPEPRKCVRCGCTEEDVDRGTDCIGAHDGGYHVMNRPREE